LRRHREERCRGRNSAKRNRKVHRNYDVERYKERNIIERFFNKLKQFRRVATRYDKLLANFMGFVKLAAIAIWLR
jgi:putative transposase